MDYLVRAAEKGYKAAMLEVAKALDTGVGLGKAPDDNPTFTAPQRSAKKKRQTGQDYVDDNDCRNGYHSSLIT